MNDELEVPRPIVHAIAQGLTAWHKKIAFEGYCADGPDCLWCPAEVIAETFYRKMQEAGSWTE